MHLIRALVSRSQTLKEMHLGCVNARNDDLAAPVSYFMAHNPHAVAAAELGGWDARRGWDVLVRRVYCESTEAVHVSHSQWLVRIPSKSGRLEGDHCREL